MDFLSYIIFLFIGLVLGAVLGRRVMLWAWDGATFAKREEIIFWVALVMAYSYLASSGRFYW